MRARRSAVRTVQSGPLEVIGAAGCETQAPPPSRLSSATGEKNGPQENGNTPLGSYFLRLRGQGRRHRRCDAIPPVRFLSQALTPQGRELVELSPPIVL